MPPRDLTGLCRRIAGHASRRPEHPAIEDANGSTSYAQLWQNAVRAAWSLRAAGSDGTVVLVATERGAPFVTAALGCWLSGTAYLPVATDTGLHRLRGIVQDSGARLAIASERRAPLCRDAGLDPLVLGPGNNSLPEPGRGRPGSSLPPDAAYVVYTSGSTGRPKGVVVGHASLDNLVDWHIRTYSIGPGDRGLHTAGLGFDAAVWEVWPYLAAGATVVTCPDEDRFVPDFVAENLIEKSCTVAFVATVIAEELLTLRLSAPRLRFLLTGGDELRLTGPAPRDFRLVNHYGPSEATVVTTVHPVSRGNIGSRPPIGVPIDGASVLVLDEQLRAVADGAEGEIFVGGRVLALGYLHDPDLTSRRFVSVPGRSGRWYRTGDLAVRRDGELEFRRRVDLDQLKVRGVRIEAAEIESALLSHPLIRTAAVVLTGQGAQGSLLALLTSADPPPSAESVRSWLRDRLPHAVIPNRFVYVDRLPLTDNGKLDRPSIATIAAGEGLTAR